MHEEIRETTIKRLLYSSWHRGCKETDHLLGKFAKTTLSSMSENELSDYSLFLEENDWDIFNWLTGKSLLPEKHNNSAIHKLLDFHSIP
jgi:antitoxin CptB